MTDQEQALLSARPDYAAIGQWVERGARVLDLGCGDGSLLRYRWQARQAPGYGVEIDAPGGHDAFLLEDPRYHNGLRAYFASIDL